MVKTSVITLKTKLCRPNHLHPEDSRRLEIVGADVKKINAAVDENKINAAADEIKINASAEDVMHEYNHIKENTVFDAYVTIAGMYAAGADPHVGVTRSHRFPLPCARKLSSLVLTPSSGACGATSGPLHIALLP